MGEYVIAKVGDILEGQNILVEVAGKSIGVFNINGEYHAILNYCPHQGGPVCEGGIFPNETAEVLENRKFREYLNYDQMVVACPWHGWEFNIKTGKCMADQKRGLLKYKAEVIGSDIVIQL